MPASESERLEALREPVKRAADSLRRMADLLVENLAASDDDWANAGNLASWLEGAYAGDPSYCKGTETALRHAVKSLLAVCVQPHKSKPGFWTAYYGGKLHHFPCYKTASESVFLYGEATIEAAMEEAAS